MPLPLQRREFGRADARPVILLHPLAGALEFWTEPASDLADAFRLIAYDQRGFGGSPVPERPWSLADHARDLEDVRAASRTERVVLAGVAVGGMIAVTYAAMFPERVEALVLANPAVRIGRDRLLARVEKAIAGGIEAITAEAVDGAFTGMPRDERYRRYTDLFRRNNVPGYAMTARGIQDAEIETLLPKLRVPVLVLAGAQDQLVTPQAAEATAGKITGARFAVLDGAAHLAPFQAPTAFAAEARRFLAA